MVFNLIFIGVGKTSLLHRYTQNKFDPKNTTSTSGAFFVTKKVYVNGLKVRLQLWDTAGQERFRSMVRLLPYQSSVLQRHLTERLLPGAYVLSRYALDHPQLSHVRFLKYFSCLGANAALVLYDITNSSTFDDIRGWLEGERDSPRANVHLP